MTSSCQHWKDEVDRHVMEMRCSGCRCLRISAHELLQHEGVVHSVPYTLRICHDLVALPLLHQTVDDLLGTVGPLVHSQSHVHVRSEEKISELLTHLQLVLTYPLLKKLRATYTLHFNFESKT